MRDADQVTAGSPVPSQPLPGILRERARSHGDQTWLQFGERSLTFAHADEVVDAYAAGFSALGVQPGDRVAVMLDVCEEYVWCNFGLARIGAIHVPVNTDYRGEFLRHMLAVAGCRIAITEECLADHFDEMFDRDGVVVEQLLIRGVGAVGGSTRLPRKLLRSVPQAGATPPNVELGERSPFGVYFTSGTTGRSKGVVLSHRYWRVAVAALNRYRDMREDDVLYGFSPMFHAGMWLYNVLAGLIAGVRVGIDPNFSASRFWDRVRFYGATQLWTVGAMNSFLWNQAETPQDANNDVRNWVAVPLAADLVEPFQRRFGIENMLSQYGQTEIVPVTATRVGDDLPPGSAGRPVDYLEVALLNEDGHRVPQGDMGEICVRPLEPAVLFDGYFGDPEATLSTLRDLWYHTGDLGRFGNQGELYFIDREKDYLRVRGENISSFEIEAALESHEDVLEVAAIAVASEYSEDELMVCVVPKPNRTLGAEDVAAFAHSNLPSFAQPRYIDVVGELPHTPTGRVRKFELRERGVTSSTWEREPAGVMREAGVMANGAKAAAPMSVADIAED